MEASPGNDANPDRIDRRQSSFSLFLSRIFICLLLHNVAVFLAVSAHLHHHHLPADIVC